MGKSGNFLEDLDAVIISHSHYDHAAGYRDLIEYNMGSVQIGSTEFEGMSDQAYLDNQAPHTAQIQCDVGQVKVSFSR